MDDPPNDVPYLRLVKPQPKLTSASVPDDARYLNERQLCGQLGIAAVTARKWRARGEGPPFAKLGRLVRYAREDVEAWLRACTFRNSA